MTVVVLVLILVAIAAFVVDERKRRRKRATPVAHSDVVRRVESFAPVADAPIERAPRASDPVPIERAQRMSPGRDTHVAKPRKPKASKQAVLDELKRSGPSTARELSSKFAGASPTIIAGLLVRLRGDGKVTSAQRRNLQVWTAS